MAAILCQGIASIFTVICECTDRVCHTVCTGPCKLCAASCSTVCEGLAKLCTNPFSLYVAVALIAQVPSIIIGLTELGGLPNCRGSVFLLGSTLFGVVNIVAAFYLALRVGNSGDPALQEHRAAFSRASHVLCHDPWMAAYILVLIGFFGWLCLGIAWNWGGVTDEDITCSDSVLGKARTSVGFGWFFLVGGSMALTMSMCCACFDNRDYATSTNNNSNNNATPNPDVENPNFQSPPPPQQSYNNNASQQQQQQQKPSTYSQQGNDAEVDEDGIPVAHAEPIPPPMPPPSAPSEAETGNFNKTAEPSMPGSKSPPPQASSEAQQEEEQPPTGGAAKAGAGVGKNIGKLFKVDAAKQQDLEKKGKQAGEAATKGFLNAKNFVTSKLNKTNNNGVADSNNNNT
jgi:hypothetical protein